MNLSTSAYKSSVGTIDAAALYSSLLCLLREGPRAFIFFNPTAYDASSKELLQSQWPLVKQFMDSVNHFTLKANEQYAEIAAVSLQPAPRLKDPSDSVMDMFSCFLRSTQLRGFATQIKQDGLSFHNLYLLFRLHSICDILSPSPSLHQSTHSERAGQLLCQLSELWSSPARLLEADLEDTLASLLPLLVAPSY
jgi:hypothetical protein